MTSTDGKIGDGCRTQQEAERAEEPNVVVKLTKGAKGVERKVGQIKCRTRIKHNTSRTQQRKAIQTKDLYAIQRAGRQSDTALKGRRRTRMKSI